jgi:hypothetical protein
MAIEHIRVSIWRHARARQLACALALLLTACAGVPQETLETIAAREPILLRASSGFGYIYPGSREAVTWQSGGTLVLTPTTLYHLGPTTRTVSYAMIDRVSSVELPDSLGLITGKQRSNLLKVAPSRPVCGDACAFNLVDNPELVGKAIEIIEAGRAQVDPFGRVSGPRNVWLAAGIRSSRFWWGVAPSYVQANAPQTKKSLDEHFCAHMDCRGKGASAGLYGDALRKALNRAPANTAYRFAELPGVVLNHRAELNTRALANALADYDATIDSLLVSDVTAVTLRERISADYEVSIEVTVKSFVDYFALHPLQDGRYFWSYHTETRPAAEWLAFDADAFAALFVRAANKTGCTIFTDLRMATDRALCPA